MSARIIALVLLAMAVSCPALGETIPAGERQAGIGETALVYRTKEKAGADFTTYTDVVTRGQWRGIEVYRIEMGRQTVILQASDLKPLLAEETGADGSLVKRIECDDEGVFFDIPARRLKKRIRVEGEYCLVDALFHYLRAFPFGSGREIVLDLLMDGRRGSTVGKFRLYVKEIGREEVRVPAGVFDCYQLEMGVPGLAGLFAGKYKYYFWHTVEWPHYLVKYYDKPTGGLTELVEAPPARS